MSISRRKNKNGGHHWLTISDLMSGLMILFIFISVSFMRSTLLERDRATEFMKSSLIERDRATAELKKITHIAETYQQNQEAIYRALIEAFPQELLAEDALNAEIDKNTLTFIFKSSDTLFDNASANLKDDYKISLDRFLPLYIHAILPYKDSISEIRIEGHTSSVWSSFPRDVKQENEKVLYSYLENMKLSQARTNAVLQYMLSTLQNTIPNESHHWLRNNTAAVGLSFSKSVLKEDGTEDFDRSRRVTFRIITNADSKIQQIIQESLIE